MSVEKEGEGECHLSSMFALAYHYQPKRSKALISLKQVSNPQLFFSLLFLFLLLLCCQKQPPSSPTPPPYSNTLLGSALYENGSDSSSILAMAQARVRTSGFERNPGKVNSSAALRGLGSIFRMGTSAMQSLVVSHLHEDSSAKDFRLFLRTLHRSGITANADLVLLLPSTPLRFQAAPIIRDEERAFRTLISSWVASRNGTAAGRSSISPADSNCSISPFQFNAFVAGMGTAGEMRNPLQPPIWGEWGQRSNLSVSGDGLSGSDSGSEASDPTGGLLWGSIVAFEAAELNPDDALQGFIDRPPMQLRRWACYQMLLGMVRRRFKHILVTEASGTLVLRDPLARLRRKGGNNGKNNGGLYLSLEDRTWGKGKPPTVSICESVYGRQLWRSLDESEKRHRLVNSGAIMGGIVQIRGLANAMVTEIVRVALERKSRSPFPDNVLLSYLLHRSSSVLGKRVTEHLRLWSNEDAVVHSLAGSRQRHLVFRKGRQTYSIVSHPSGGTTPPTERVGGFRRRRWHAVARIIHRDICSSPPDAALYPDCHQTSSSKLAPNLALI